MPHRLYSVKAQKPRASCSSTSSRETARASQKGRSSAPPASCSDECLDEAGVDRSLCYVTNAVKHFKFEPRGKRRIHAKPSAGEVQRCAWWLGGELDVLRSDLVVALGATALYSLMGRSVDLNKERGHILKTSSACICW